MKNIAICVASYKRPLGLKRLLESFDALVYQGGQIEIFIADNDQECHEGFDYVETTRSRHCHKIHCEIEVNPGISFARNRCLEMAYRSGDRFSYFAFTDDDIVVSQNWVTDLVFTAETYGASVVFGKREPRFEYIPSAEILSSSLFHDEFQCPVSGTEVQEGPTSNMLVVPNVFDKLGHAPFDVNLSLSGGEDTDFCIQLRLNGFRIVAGASAVCYEFFPKERLSEQWITDRYFRTGSTYGYLTKKYKSSAIFYFGAGKKMLVLVKLYLIFLLSGDLSAKCRLYNTLGYFYYLTRGSSFQEYRRKS
jgi:GT2 family glycosyltransferase